MKQIILLGARDHGEKNSIHVMKKVFDSVIGERVTAVPVHFEDLLFIIQTDNVRIIDTRSGKDIADTDLVVAVNWYKNGPQAIYRDVAYSIGLYLEQRAVPFWNHEMVRQRSIGKLSAMVQFALHALDVPKTYFSLDTSILLKEVPDMFPVVAKDAMASRGRRNHLLSNGVEFETCLQRVVGVNRYIVQEAISNDGDLRVVCFANEPKFVIWRKRTREDTHLHNVSQGGSAKQLHISDLPDTVVEACRRICKLMGREMAGIDILPATDGSGRFVFLEANAVPQLTSGSYVEEKLHIMAKTIEEYVRGRK